MGNYMYVEGRVTDTQGRPIPNAVIDTWETDGEGLYDTQVRIWCRKNQKKIMVLISHRKCL